MKKLQWLLERLNSSNLTTPENISVYVEEGTLDYTWDAEDYTLGVRYNAQCLIKDWKGKTAPLFVTLAQVLNEIDPNRSKMPTFSAVIIDSKTSDIVFSIQFEENESLIEVPCDQQDYDMQDPETGKCYRFDNQLPPPLEPFNQLVYMPRADYAEHHNKPDITPPDVI